MPVTPGAAGASFDVLLSFSLDPEANRRVQQGVSTLEQELNRIRDEAKGVGEDYQKSGEKVKSTSKEITQDLRAQARAMRAEAAAITDDLRAAQIGLLRDLSGTIQNISTKALVAGGAIIGGIFAEVQNYVSKAPEATRETRAWAAAMGEIGENRSRIDRELLRTTLPLLQEAGRISGQVAGFVESHPEITSIALKAGALLVGVGVIGTAVSRGIKLVADIQYLATIPTQLTAAKLQDIAADKQLLAAQNRIKDLGGKIPGGGAAGFLAGAAVPITAIIAATLAHTAFQAILIRAGAGLRKELGLDKVITGGAELLGRGFGRLAGLDEKEIQRKAVVFSAIIGRLTGDIDENSQIWKQAAGSIKSAGDAVAEAAGRIRGSANEAAIVEAFASWKEDDARIIREAAENRKKIISETEREIAQITRSYSSQRVDINRRFNEQRASIVQQFEQENIEAERQYQEERAQITAEGSQRLRDLEESHLERLRQLRRDSEDRLEELAADRDALGIVKEQRRLAEAEQEENRSFRLEAARARRETEQRLAQLDAQHLAERARRQAQFEQDLQENEAQRAAELAQAAEAYRQEVTQAREAQAQKLRELQEGLNAERERRREVFLEQIRDLDASLLGERALRQRYYNDMLADAEAFFAQYRAAMPSSSSFSSVTGSVGTIPNNQGDALLATSKTVAAAVGGVMARVLSSGDTRTAVYNDQRRLQYPMSKNQKRDYEETATRALEKALGVT